MTRIKLATLDPITNTIPVEMLPSAVTLDADLATALAGLTVTATAELTTSVATLAAALASKQDSATAATDTEVAAAIAAVNAAAATDAELAGAVASVTTALAAKQDAATAASDTELAAAVALITTALSAKQDASAAATDAELAVAVATINASVATDAELTAAITTHDVSAGAHADLRASLADASPTVRGITKISPDPVSPTNPIAVGTNHAALTDARAPTGSAGGVLSGSFPDPGFAVDMATQSELGAATDAVIGRLLTDLAVEGAARIDAAAAHAALTTGAHGISGLLASKADLVAGLVPTAQLPALAITDVFPVASQAGMLALTAQRGDLAIRSDVNQTFILATENPATLADWKLLATPADAVLSINGQAGIVVLAAADVGAAPTSRMVSAGAGLTGGGDLTVNRALAADFGMIAGKVTQGNDSRLSDARTPTAHKVSHAIGGADALTSADVGADASGTASAAVTTHAGAADPHGDRAYADGLIAANDALVYKGVLSASANPNYPAASAGHMYKISVAGKIGGASGVNVEVGDSILCTVDATLAGTHAAVGASWSIIQTNLDGAVIGPAGAVSGNVATFSGTGGKLVQDSGLALDTDQAFAANSDARLPSQKAVAAYVATLLAAQENTDVQVFTVFPDTWVRPTGRTLKRIRVWGVQSGGSGGGGRKSASGTAAYGGAGGGGASRAYAEYDPAQLGATEPVTGGNSSLGGAGATANSTNGSPGSTGVATTFGVGPLFSTGTAPGGGSGGTTTTGTGGTVPIGMFVGVVGGAGNAGGGVAGGPSTSACGGGGGGGGLAVAPAASNGGAGGGSRTWGSAVGGAAGAAPGGGGGAGQSQGAASIMPGGGGGGGASSITANGGAGGAGGFPGGPGGGGGAALDGVGNAGAGGAGAGGICVVVTEF